MITKNEIIQKFKKEINLIVDLKNNKEYLETNRYNRETFDIKDRIHILERNNNSDLCDRVHTLEDQINNLINNLNNNNNFKNI